MLTALPNSPLPALNPSHSVLYCCRTHPHTSPSKSYEMPASLSPLTTASIVLSSHKGIIVHICMHTLHHPVPHLGEFRSGYPLLVCTHLNTHRYIVHPSSIGGNLCHTRVPDQCHQLHHVTLVLEIPKFPTAPAHQPWPYSHTCGPRVINLRGRKKQTQREMEEERKYRLLLGTGFGGISSCFHGAGTGGGQGDKEGE